MSKGYRDITTKTVIEVAGWNTTLGSSLANRQYALGGTENDTLPMRQVAPPYGAAFDL